MLNNVNFQNFKQTRVLWRKWKLLLILLRTVEHHTNIFLYFALQLNLPPVTNHSHQLCVGAFLFEIRNILWRHLLYISVCKPLQEAGPNISS